jgi:hypothetical protein
MTTQQPSAHYRQHHEVDAPRVDTSAFRQGWRVRTRLDQLLADQRITSSEWQAEVEFRKVWSIACELAGTEPGMVRATGAASADAGLIARLDAVARLRAVEDHIGPLATGLCIACVILDLPWAEIARTMHRNPQTVRDWTALAIRAHAAAWWGAGRRPGRRAVLADQEPAGGRVARS